MVQLVSVILLSISSYWCQLFILPKAIIKEMNAICRSYIWHIDPNNTALGNVNWKDVCKPKNLGEHGIRNIKY